MLLTTTSDQDFTIATDFYPYTETRNKIHELSEWFINPTRSYIKNNYDLDSLEFNSLNFSLNDKLRNGIFNFLYYQGNCVAFCGLQISGDSAWSHRLFTSPDFPKSILGSVSTFIFPYHTSYAIKNDCKFYKHTFNKKNIRFYKWYRDSLFLGRVPKKYINGSVLLSRYEYVGIEIINNCEQLVCRLDLNRSDIEDFCKL